MKILANIFYSGIVQGVGFRYTTLNFAQNLGLTGWVRNLADGRVEILAEGEKASVQTLMDKLDEYFSGSIHHKHLTFKEAPPVAQFHGFEITQ